jgi:Asp-tRNA(Asn)/Glu-tRNA(Gln) amidotransferase A subunit family amidase
MTSPEQMTAAEVVAAVKAGDLTATDVAEAIIDRYNARNADVEAFAYFDPDQIRTDAKKLDAASEKGPLHGVPVGLKDVINTRDMPTEHHNARYAGSRPGIDAACVDTLRAAGSLFVGKTVTTEFAATGNGGPTKNPLDPTRTPGGSSSGSAAAVADFQAALALGTQTGGSTIRPGSFCGIYALKPTWNSVSREGLKMYSATCDTAGFYARSADDLMLVADVFDLDPPETPLPTSLDSLKVAVCQTPNWPKALPAAQTAMDHGTASLAAAGAVLTELTLDGDFLGLIDAHGRILDREGRSAFLGEYRNNPRLLDSFKCIVENRNGLTPTAAREAYKLADRCRAQIDDIAAQYDVILAPSSTGEAPVGIDSTGDASFNGIWTVLQVPVVNIPGHTGPAGMPVGLSFIGRRYDDRRVIAAAGLAGSLWAGRRAHDGRVDHR